MKQLSIYQKVALILFIIIELVGFWGILSPEWHDLFVSMTATNLLFVSVVLLIFHKGFYRLEMAWMILVFLVGYFVEVLGVATGMVFGEYSYGDGLGPKILDVPPTMGINWFLLCYTTVRSVKNVPVPNVVKAVLASGLMVFLDFVMEPVAIAFDYWSWQGGVIPTQNYVAWFVVAFFLNLLWFQINSKGLNKFSRWVLLYLVVFFTIMNLVFA